MSNNSLIIQMKRLNPINPSRLFGKFPDLPIYRYATGVKELE